MTAVARILQYGASKYFDLNWKQGGKPDEEYLSACMRHLVKHVAGETFDPETGCLHVGHAVWNLLTLIENNHDGPVTSEDFEQCIAYWEQLPRCEHCQARLIPDKEHACPKTTTS